MTAEKKGRRARLFLRRARRASWLPIAKGSHGGWRGEAAARVLRVRSLSSRSTWRGRAYGHLRCADAPGRADVVPSRGQLVVCQRQPVFARAERLVRVGQQRAPGLPTGSPRIDAWQATPAAAEKYRTSRGHDEFQTDGTCVNTDQGWKEMRVGVFAKRMPGAAARLTSGPRGSFLLRRCGWRLRPWKTTGRLPPAGRWWLRGWGFAPAPNWMSWPMGRAGFGSVSIFTLSLHRARWTSITAGACRPDRPGAVRRRDDGGSTLASRGAGRTVGGRLARHPARDRSRVSSPLVRRNAPRCVAWPITCVRMPNTWTIENAWPLAGPSAAVASKGPAKTIWDDDSNKPAPVGLFPTQIGWQP